MKAKPVEPLYFIPFECILMVHFFSVSNAIFIVLSLTPLLLQFLVKRFVVDIRYNADTKVANFSLNVTYCLACLYLLLFAHRLSTWLL